MKASKRVIASSVSILLFMLTVFLGAGTAPPKAAHAEAYSAGYYIVTSNGAVYNFGDAINYGSMAGHSLNAPIVGMAVTPDGHGYWLVASDGGIFSFGDAQFYGSMGGKPLNKPIVGMAPTPDGKGYWEVASDGGIFTFGDASFYGSMGGKPLNKPVVGMAATPDGHGYWEVASDGGIFTFGDASFYGSMGGKPLNKPVVGMAATPDGHGYWEVASDGGIFTFGDASFYGSMGGKPLNQPVTGMASVPGGQGYWLVAKDGGIFSFGSSPFYGSVPGIGTAPAPIVGMAAVQYPTPPVLSIGWGYFNTSNAESGGWADLMNNYDQLSTIIPDWYYLSNVTQSSVSLGEWPGTSMIQQVVSYAHTHAVSVWPSIGWTWTDSASDPLTSQQDISSLVSQIVSAVNTNGYDGMSIDFEGMPVSDYSGLDSFIQQLASALHADGKRLMVATYPSEYPDSPYDFAVLGQYADYINMMTYSNHNGSSYEGPNAGYPWVSGYVNQALQSVPASKLVVGLGPYGHAWTVSNTSGVSGDEIVAGQDYVTAQYTDTYITQNGITPLYDPWQQELTFTEGTPLTQSELPAPGLSTADESTYLPQVQELQALLQYILVRYAVDHNQSEPTAISDSPYGLLQADGYYGTLTADAVQEFQTDYGVSASGNYDSATQQALLQAVSQYNIGPHIFWVENATATTARMALVVAQHLGGFASWRLGFEDAAYWSQMSQIVNVAH